MVSIVNKIKLAILPTKRRIYAVLEGQYKGEWLIVIKRTGKNTIFFSLPDKHIREIPNDDFKWGLSNNVLEAVDVLPKAYYNVCVAEYNYIATDVKQNNAFNRREQHASPDSLDRE